MIAKIFTVAKERRVYPTIRSPENRSLLDQWKKLGESNDMFKLFENKVKEYISEEIRDCTKMFTV